MTWTEQDESAWQESAKIRDAHKDAVATLHMIQSLRSLANDLESGKAVTNFEVNIEWLRRVHFGCMEPMPYAKRITLTVPLVGQTVRELMK